VKVPARPPQCTPSCNPVNRRGHHSCLPDQKQCGRRTPCPASARRCLGWLVCAAIRLCQLSVEPLFHPFHSFIARVRRSNPEIPASPIAPCEPRPVPACLPPPLLLAVVRAWSSSARVSSPSPSHLRLLPSFVFVRIAGRGIGRLGLSPLSLDDSSATPCRYRNSIRFLRDQQCSATEPEPRAIRPKPSSGLVQRCISAASGVGYPYGWRSFDASSCYLKLASSSPVISQEVSA
jgi:hypothetical protein